MDIIIDPKTVPIPLEVRNKWQNIVNILTRIMQVPSALIMKVDYPAFTVYQASDSPENPFKPDQEFTLPAGVYCEKTMESKDVNLIPNALKDPEWDKNPSIGIGLISYLGVPIFYPNKKVFGTLCVLDKKENAYTRDYKEIMLQFKDIIESHLMLLWQNSLLENTLARQKDIERQLTEKMKIIEEMDKIYAKRQLETIPLKKKIDVLEEELRKARHNKK